MGNGTKFKLSSMFPSVLSKIKGMTGKKPKGKGTTTNPSDWSDIQDFSTVSKDSPSGPPSPVRTFPQNRDRDMRYCSSPGCSSPVNHKSYDIRFPTESPVRRGGGTKSGPVSPPRRSANSTDSGCYSFEPISALLPPDRRFHKTVPPTLNSDIHSDSELDITDAEPASARAHLRARTMSLQLDRTTEWERERAREKEWSEPEKSSPNCRRRRMREEGTSKISTDVEPSPIHTVRCMPPNTPSDAGNYSDHPREMECHRSACPDFFSREMTTDLNTSLPLDRKLSFTTDDNRLFDDTYTSFSSDEDFFKVRCQQHNTTTTNAAIDHYRLKKFNKYGNGDTTDAGFTSSTEVVLTEDEERSLRLAKTVRNAAVASDGWARVQSRFAEEEKHAPQTTMTRIGRVNYDRKAADESDVLLLTEDDERQHAAICRREGSLENTVLSVKDWARENSRALSKARELEKQAKLLLRAEEDSAVEYESFGLPVIHKEHLHSRTHSPVGEVEKHTKGRIDYKSSSNDNHHHLEDHASDNLVYEQFSQPLAEYASDFYRNAQTEESDFETSIAARPWEVEFPSFRSDRGSRRSGPLELSESEAPTPRTQRSTLQERSSRTPKKQNPPTSATTHEIVGRKASRSASSPKVQDVPVSSVKPSSRSGSPRRQELHGGKRATSPRTPSARQEAMSKKVSRTQSPRRQEVSGLKPSSNSPSQGQHQQQQQDASNNNDKVNNARNASPAHSPGDSQKKKKGGHARPSSEPRAQQEERTSVVGSDSVAVMKASYDPYQDFRESMVEMILEHDIQTAEDLEELLLCYLSLNSAENHSIIVQVFSDIWRDIFDL